MHRFARLATRLLAAPMGLVWIEPSVDDPAAVPECWPPDAEPDPIVLECCRRVVESGRPQFLTRTGDDPAPFAFAAVPLLGVSGEPLGVLAAVAHGLRAWSEEDVRDLTDLAGACAAQMRMRSRSETGREAREAAEDAAQVAEDDAARAERLLSRSELLLRASEELAGTSGLDDVRQRVADLVSGELKPARIELTLLQQGRLHVVQGPVDEHPPGGVAEETATLDSPGPVAQSVRESRVIVVGGPAVGAPDLHTVACLPLRGARGVLGALMLGWDAPYGIGVDERALLATLAGYTAQAIERALHLDERITAARELQGAMLTELPDVPGLELAALYRPAAQDDMVGGDWYDAYPLPDSEGAPRAFALTVGDITGHDMQAAALMGQVRSMLRQADHDHPDEGPGEALFALEQACRRLEVPASGTAVHAHLKEATDGHWHLRWANAGHPSPLLLTPEGVVEALTQHDVLFHDALPPGPRTCAEHTLRPGSTLLLYTDGLVEERTADIDEGVDRLTRMLAGAPTGIGLTALLRHLLDTVAPRRAQDDTVLFAVRIPAAPNPSRSPGQRA